MENVNKKELGNKLYQWIMDVLKEKKYETVLCVSINNTEIELKYEPTNGVYILNGTHYSKFTRVLEILSNLFNN